MGRRKREPMSEGKRNIIAGLLQEYDIRTAKDIEDALKDLMSGTIQEMLEAEMDEHLGYSSYERSDNIDYRNGKKAKKIRGNFGETEIEVPQDRDGSFEPKVVQKRQKDIYGFEVSDGMVSDITDRLLPQIEEWCKGYSCDMCRRAFRNERSSSCCISADRITALHCSSGEKYTEICRRKKQEGICK